MGRLRIASTVVFLGTLLVCNLLFSVQLFAYGGGGGDEENFSARSPGSPGGPPVDNSYFEEENIDPEFRTPDFVRNDHPYNRDPWAKIEKPSHWTDAQWKSYLTKKMNENMRRFKEGMAEGDTADRNHTIAKGAGYAATAAGAVVGVIAAPAVAPTIVIISVAGDGAAATAGNLAEGKDIGESLKEGLKKSTSSAIISKVATGKKAADAFISFAGSVGYDNIDIPDKPMDNQMPPPEFYTPTASLHPNMNR